MGMRAFHTSEKVGPRTRQRREEKWTGLFVGAFWRDWWMGRRVREARLT
jgi:hypothetical protein